MTIASPSDGATVRQGLPVELSGSGLDQEDGVLPPDALGWTSSIDGPLGTGSPVARDDLSTGTHEIRLTGVDEAGNPGHSTVLLVVTPPNDPPVVAITEPLDGAVVAFGSSLRLSGTASDPEDGALAGEAIDWTSDRDGSLGTGESVVRDDLSIGSHTVTLTARDSGGATTTTSIVVTVDGPPSVTILAPKDGSDFEVGAPVIFQGDAVDAEDGPLADDRLKWESSLDGNLGTGRNFTRSDLSPGIHDVVLSAADALGTVSADTVTLEVEAPENRAPTATIQSPANGATFDEGQAVVFSGTGTDPDEGSLTGSALRWSSSRDGLLGNGVSVTTSDLSVGTHEITLRVTDSQGARGTDEIIITVEPANTAPRASISSPSSGDEFVEGAAITLSGSGVDDEDGSVPGSRMRWSSSRDGSLGTGASLVRSDLSVGTHTLTLTVEDSEGATDQTSVNIVVQVAVSFEDDVLPLFRNPGNMLSNASTTCTSCHFTQSASSPDPDWWQPDVDVIYGQLTLTTPPRVRSGDTTFGALLCQITAGAISPSSCDVDFLQNGDMRVTSSALAVVLRWIEQGARNN